VPYEVPWEEPREEVERHILNCQGEEEHRHTLQEEHLHILHEEHRHTLQEEHRHTLQEEHRHTLQEEHRHTLRSALAEKEGVPRHIQDEELVTEGFHMHMAVKRVAFQEVGVLKGLNKVGVRLCKKTWEAHGEVRRRLSSP
jgi:hypothetical protein